MGRFIIARASFGDLHNMYKAEGGEEERKTEQLSRLVFLSGHTMTFRMRCSLRLSFHVLRALCRPFYSILLFQGVLLLFLKRNFFIRQYPGKLGCQQLKVSNHISNIHLFLRSLFFLHHKLGYVCPYL